MLQEKQESPQQSTGYPHRFGADMPESLVATFALIIVACILCQWAAWLLKLPAIIFLLLTGIVAGPLLGWLQPEKLLGDLLLPFVSLSVAVMLFEGGLTLKYREIAGLEKVVRRMVSIGMLITWVITAIATRYALHFTWEVSFLFGAVTVVTGPTVIVPMLRTVRPTASVANILRWEGVVIDPIGASLAVLVYEFIIVSKSGDSALGHTLMIFAQIVLVGLVLGILGGYLFGITLRRHWLPEYLHNVGTLALVWGVFALSNILQHESGLVSVTIMGIWLANMKGVDVDDILNFKESLSIILISLLFIILAARIDFAILKDMGWRAVIVFLSIQFLSRPLNVMYATIGSKLSWPERHILAWIAPRGIVAAAIAAIFAIQLEKIGYTEANQFVPLTFIVIIGTVLLQSATARPIAKWLKVAEPEPKGFLVIGANKVARAIAKVLEAQGFRVLLAEANWDNIAKAKMENLETFYGNPVSEHAERHLNLVGIGCMLALSHHESMNVISAMHYRLELGANAIYVLQSKPGENVSEKLKVPIRRRSSILFGKDITFNTLADMLSRGGDVRVTNLTESFGFDQYLEKNRGLAVPLFALNPKERLRIFTAEHTFEPAPGWTIISMVAETAAAKEKSDKYVV
jgi:NhaP-type Na+/H+ or K+/H+ antiporter